MFGDGVNVFGDVGVIFGRGGYGVEEGEGFGFGVGVVEPDGAFIFGVGGVVGEFGGVQVVPAGVVREENDRGLGGLTTLWFLIWRD